MTAKPAVPYNPDAPTIVQFLGDQGYPTPAWLASRNTPHGRRWSLQEFVDGNPLTELDASSTEIFVDLVDRQRQVRLPLTLSWNP